MKHEEAIRIPMKEAIFRGKYEKDVSMFIPKLNNLFTEYLLIPVNLAP